MLWIRFTSQGGDMKPKSYEGDVPFELSLCNFYVICIMAAVVDCPTCGKMVVWKESNQYRPFCSLRCKQIDLGAWAEEKYVIPAATPPKESDEDDLPPHP